ncbi:dual specificity protein phosphatase 1-like isoform X2 [Gastrolobium bilobum]|uniref:dual specificity protein phosphatase 1-like isoform X2 n=1 Tax=Gastrolobium bilobum TaxID=150636 RepID=UPI002AB3276A|nr:dual specificity protein phosphatase 1-like isoform X2 [Gastrolobium bilobum]
MGTSAAMDQFDESMKKQIASLLRVMNLVKSFKQDNTPCKIDEGLFLGSVGTAANKDALKNLNVTHILTVAGKLEPAHPGDFVYKIIDVADREDVNLKQHFSECFDFINEAKRRGGGVLVHCFAGRSRSVTIVVAYLMKNRGMSLSEALQRVKIKRPIAAPNPGFVHQLEDFEKSLQDIEVSEYRT